MGETIQSEHDLIELLRAFTFDGPERLEFGFKSRFSTDLAWGLESWSNDRKRRRDYNQYISAGNPKSGTLYFMSTHINGIRTGGSPDSGGLLVKVDDTGFVVGIEGDLHSASYDLNRVDGELNPIPWPSTSEISPYEAIEKVLGAFPNGLYRNAHALRAFREYRNLQFELFPMVEPEIVLGGRHTATPYHCKQVREKETEQYGYLTTQQFHNSTFVLGSSYRRSGEPVSGCCRRLYGCVVRGLSQQCLV